MKDAYSEISVDEFQNLSGREKILMTFMTLKEVNKTMQGLPAAMEKRCKDCKTARNQKWILRLGGAVVGWLTLLTFRG